jgi:phage terminase large subunit
MSTTLRKLEAQVERWRAQPVDFAGDVLGVYTWSKQREILESLRDNKRTAVRSCHGPGKTFTAAVAALWFLQLPNSRVVSTAPTGSQVRKLLWHEINQLHKRSALPYGGVCLQTELRLPDGRYAIGLSPKKEEPESFQGHHAENILLIFDEASGVPLPIYEAGEGYMTTEGAKILMIGNPTQASGEFYDAFHRNKAMYNQIQISAFDLPAYTGEKVPPFVAAQLTGKAWVAEQAKKYGKESIPYIVKVLAEFPKGADDTVFGLGDVEAAGHREVPVAPDSLRVIACDVARFGTDETVISKREGLRVRIVDHYVGHATTETTGAIIREVKQAKVEAPHAKVRIVVDDDGVGGGVTDQLREKGYSVTAFKGGETAIEPDEYPNARSEAWFRVSQIIEDLDLDPDDQLAADLVAPTYKLDSAGRRVVEPKADTKKRLGRSPDRGDSVLLAFAPERDEGRLEVWS